MGCTETGCMEQATGTSWGLSAAFRTSGTSHSSLKKRHSLISQTYMCHHLQLQKPYFLKTAPWATARQVYYHPLESHWQSMSQSPRLVMHLSARFPPYTNYALIMSIFQLVSKPSCALQTANVSKYTFCSLLVPHKRTPHRFSTCLTCISHFSIVPDWPISLSAHLPQSMES